MILAGTGGCRCGQPVRSAESRRGSHSPMRSVVSCHRDSVLLGTGSHRLGAHGTVRAIGIQVFQRTADGHLDAHRWIATRST